MNSYRQHVRANLEAVIANTGVYKTLTFQLRDDPQFFEKVMIECDGDDCDILEYASDDIRNDKRLVILAVKQYGLNYKFASENLKLDDDVIREAIESDFNVYEFIPPLIKEDLVKDRAIVMQILARSGPYLRELPIKYTQDKECVMVAIKQCRWAYKFADSSLLTDVDVIKCAVQECDILHDTMINYSKYHPKEVIDMLWWGEFAFLQKHPSNELCPREHLHKRDIYERKKRKMEEESLSCKKTKSEIKE